MKKQGQNGSALIVVIIILVVAVLGTVGFLFWQNLQKNNADQTQVDDSSSKPDDDSLLTNYKNNAIGIEFTHPKAWVSLECEGRVLTVYFATDTRGVNKNQLCGGGSSYPPQMSFARITNDQYGDSAAQTTQIMIDGKEATKAIYISDGEGTRPAGYKIIVYNIPTGLEEPLLQITYNRWPTSSSELYDTSEESEAAFVELVETRLKVFEL